MTTTVLRPNSGTSFGNIDDDPVNDATSVVLSTSYSAYGLTSYTLGAGEITKSVTPRIRYSDGSPVGPSVIAALDLGTQSPTSWFPGVGVSPVTATGTYTQFSGNQTQIDGMELRLQSPVSSEVHEAYVDLVTVARPSVAVTAVSPDPYTASNFVPVAWTNTLDADGGTATRYQVTVTDDNDGDAVVYDSGEVLSALTSATVGPLVDGDYTVNVRVAQTVNGASHWSLAGTDSFEVAVVTADVDTVTVTPVNASGKITVTVARDDTAPNTAWEYVEVERSIDAGVTWTPVRLASFVDATGDADSFAVDDYEIANGQAGIYRARATYYNSGLPIAGAWVESASTSWSSSDDWIKSPLDPTLNIVMCPTDVGPGSRSNGAGVFNVVGSRYPVVVSDVLSAPSGGSLTYRTTSIAEARALDAILESDGGVLLVNLNPTSSRYGPNRDGFAYVAVTSVSEQVQERFYRGGTDRRFVTISTVDVEAPADATAGTA